MIMRTTWAERFFETFAGVPLTAECVFHSPQYLDKRTQKEVCDFLIILRGKAILVSMKTQENPLSRTQEKLQLWIIKNAREALEQAKGALRTVSQKDFWCHHSRRGRVNFIPSSITVSHIVVITEFLGEIVELPSDFKLS